MVYSKIQQTRMLLLVRGVVLPHEALVITVKGFFFVVNPTRPSDIYLGYLPLANILELLAEMWARGMYPK